MALPTRIKVNIRDLWTKPESKVQKQIAELKTLLGHDVLIEPEWALLWTALGKYFPDSATFVPAIASVVTSWCKSMVELAEDDRNAAWTDQLLEKLSKSHGLKIVLEVQDGRPSTVWVENHRCFEICFPKSDPPAQSTMIAGFHDDLRVAFEPVPQRASLPSRSNTNNNDKDELFTEIDQSDFDTASIMTPATTNRLASHPARVESLPDINMIERPEALMKKPPYHLIVQHTSYSKEISVQCSHQPSLELMSEYFKVWVKRNHNQTTKPPAAEILMRESCFGLGLMYDRLEFTLNSYDYKHGLSPVMILNFVESILGYRMTYQDAHSWTFRRDTVLH
ncbi:hypothetical protein EJ08DRAFT_680968 [Tothia fuscella]|uniref:Uncharacterized protein n=1 Tax=Tothia fuscella TaxID=1048955 RepID=A0A9P4TVC2_9PEZI|nr:hypothetical protein EJ08DRAFT_680968 [Tothia fuscella]